MKGRPWTEQERCELRAAWAASEATVSIARRMDRTEASITSKALALGLARRHRFETGGLVRGCWKRLSVDLDPDTMAEVAALARKLNNSLGGQCRELIEWGLMQAEEMR